VVEEGRHRYFLMQQVFNGWLDVSGLLFVRISDLNIVKFTVSYHNLVGISLTRRIISACASELMGGF